MQTFFDGFQIIALIAFLVVFIGRSIYLYLRYGINPLVLGVGKGGIRRATEIGFFIGLVLWIYEVAAAALHWQTRIFGGIFTTILFDSHLAKSIGVVMITGGFVLFVLVLVAFGQSWRGGIDERTPGELVTHGIFAYSRNPISIY
jgi:protein-S-isoprenylcysteine O-methyltransferase Ste14